MIEQRLQDKLRKETDTVRRAEEVKKDKTTANRKEEELQLKDSIVRLSLFCGLQRAISPCLDPLSWTFLHLPVLTVLLSCYVSTVSLTCVLRL